MTYKEAESPDIEVYEIPMWKIYQNIVGFAIAEESLLKEFTYTVKGINPLYSKPEACSRNKVLLLKKIEEISRYFRVSKDDVIADQLRIDKAKKILNRYYIGTLNGDIKWQKKNYSFISRYVCFSEKSSERVVINHRFSKFTYISGGHEIDIASLDQYGYMGEDTYGVCGINTELIEDFDNLKTCFREIFDLWYLR